VVELRNVCKSFGDIRVLDGESLCLERRFAFHLSSDEKQLLAFGNSLVYSPKLVLLNEPFAGADVENSEVLFRCIGELRNEGTTFMVAACKLKKALEVVI